MTEHEQYRQVELFSAQGELKTREGVRPSLLQLDLLLMLSDGASWPYALYKQLKATDETLHQPSVYKSINELSNRGLVEPVGKTRGKTGHEVTLFDLSASGREAIIVELKHLQGVLQRAREKGFLE